MMKRLLLTISMAFITGQSCAQSLIPFSFTSEEDNRLIRENDSVKYYVASGDTTNTVAINEDASYYKMLGRDRKVIAEGAFVTEGEKLLQDGKWTARFENGKLQKEGYYRKSDPIGTWQEYYSNGKLKSIANYAIITGEHGEQFSCMSGTYQEFFQDGKLKITGFYTAVLMKTTDTMKVEDPVSGRSVVKYVTHNEYYPEKTSHWEYYTEDGELDKKEDF